MTSRASESTRRASRVAVASFTAIVAAFAPVASVARADPPAAAGSRESSESSESSESKEVTRAREEFLRAVPLARASRWGEALAAFESSQRIVPHPTTLFNIGACERAMGRYTRARDAFERALADDAARGGKALVEAQLADARAYVDEIGRLIATANVTLDPPGAQIAVDGRPLAARRGANGVVELVAGTRDAGPGEAPSVPRFRLALDPGTHVITLSRRGFRDAVVNRDFAPGSTIDLKLELNRLPATLTIRSSPDAATVSLDDVDVGTTPIALERRAGTYRVLVRKPGFVSHAEELVLQAGDHAEVVAPLDRERPSLTQSWWFWTGAGVLLAGAATTTYFLARDHSRPPVDGGTLNWTVPAR